MNPTIAPEPATPAQMPTALLRSLFGNAAVSSDSVAGMMNAAPTPATARATMICTGLSKNRRRKRCHGEDRQARQQRAAPPVPVADAPAGSSRHASTSV